MFKKRPEHNVKYEAVISHEDFDNDNSISTRFWSPKCIWSSSFTILLIGTYYIPSICLTFYQRWLYQSFHFPFTTVLVHMNVKYLLAIAVRYCMDKKEGKSRLVLGWREYVFAMGPAGIFSGLDIALSNWGLEIVNISLYTMTKSTTIIFILMFAILFKLERKSWSLCSIVIMITIGLLLFTYKSTTFNVFGFALLILASLSSGVRWACVQLLMQKSKMGMKHPVDMIYHMQPWMILIVMPFFITLEAKSAVVSCQLFRYDDQMVLIDSIMKMVLGAFIAFLMEAAEVLVITYTSSLTLAIAGILKDMFVVLLAVEWIGDPLSPINVVGLLICLCGISSHVAYKMRTVQNMPNQDEIFNLSKQERFELGQNLLSHDSGLDGLTFDAVMDDSDDSDAAGQSEVIFDILNKHDR